MTGSLLTFVSTLPYACWFRTVDAAPAMRPSSLSRRTRYLIHV
jgi:hypothetical protein